MKSRKLKIYKFNIFKAISKNSLLNIKVANPIMGALSLIYEYYFAMQK